MKLKKIVKQFRVDKPEKFRLADYDPADTCGIDLEKEEAKAMLADGVKRLADLQEVLYAQNQWSVLARNSESCSSLERWLVKVTPSVARISRCTRFPTGSHVKALPRNSAPR